MKILVACEFSGTVRDALIRAGHDAWSCDLLPTEAPGPHLQCSVLDVLAEGWDGMIAHPPCTHLAVSGARHFEEKREDGRQQEALAFVKALMDAPIPRIAIENPVSIINSQIRWPDQIIQPWMFGEDASKTTCLWLKRLRPLVPTKIIPPEGWHKAKCTVTSPLCFGCGCLKPLRSDLVRAAHGVVFVSSFRGPMVWANQTPSRQNKLCPSPDRWKQRSATYKGIADAMATQWFKEIKQQ